ncbi:MAG TPA: hypothetical protein VJZ76_16390 [Thermoanaerobaculia bacterium]|nr:hypothetical protein [Thermoanaerobaculia bacterium]
MKQLNHAAVLIAGIVVMAMASATYGYDNGVVHPKMTGAALKQALASRDFLKPIGLSMNAAVGGQTPDVWLATGAHDEDERLAFTSVQFHFFDPVNELPMTVFKASWLPPFGSCQVVFESSATAPEWALTPLNEFHVGGARNQYFAGLTGPNKAAREQAFGATFLALGHLVHLVQDMAQPQHTRNDFHLSFEGTPFDPLQPLVSKTWSRYEKWCQVNLTDARNGAYSGYPLVKLADYRDYFKTGDGRGLAEYSNRNFVTEHTNFSDSLCAPFDYSSPGVGTPREEHHTITTYTTDANGSLNATVTDYDDSVFTYQTSDAYVGNGLTYTANAYHDFLSFFDYELNRERGERVYSLPSVALGSQASLLVPRAVGYSAGFIDHFFRGKVDVDWTPSGPNNYKVTITNRSAEKIGPDAKLTAYFVAAPSYFGRTTSDDTWRIFDGPIGAYVQAFGGIEPGGSVTFGIDAPSALHSGDDLNKFERRIAVRATLGSEPDAVIGLVQPAKPNNDRGLKFVVTASDPLALVNLRSSADRLKLVELGHGETIYNSLPNATVEVTANPLTYTVRIDPIDPAGYYTEGLLNWTECSRTANVTASWYVDGVFVKSVSATETACSISSLGRYP